MAGPLQVGDIINLGKIAWDIYRLGWDDDLNATRQYIEFGGDVKGLAESLDTLTRVVHQASSSLQSQGAYNIPPRWDPVSLNQIIGNYRSTLRDCHELLEANRRYGVRTNALKNIEWNVLVQPTVDGLRQRIALHNAKVLHFIKPFEIDLMCRVREDIRYMHTDLSRRITAMHIDVRRSMGIVVSDLDQELNQQAHRRVYLLDVPSDVAEKFRAASLTERPELDSDEAFDLEDLSDAFIFNYNRSTQDFRGGMFVSDRIAPVDKYLNLLKCIWLLRKMKNAPQVLDTEPNSHWPSFVRQLEDDLSFECSRFGRDLVNPTFMLSTLRGDMFSIWPERELPRLIDVVTQDEMMEQLLEVELQGSTPSVEQKVKLLRRMGADGRKFRVMISGVEQTVAGRPRQQSEVIDFDITTATINPQYALPGGLGMIQEIILRRDEKIARMPFLRPRDMLEFQQAITGFKPWAYYSRFVTVGFVISGQRDHVFEEACVQLWIPKQTAGSLVTNSDAAAETNKAASPSRSGSVTTASAYSYNPTSPSPSGSVATSSVYSFNPASPNMHRDGFQMSSPFGVSGESFTTPMGRQPSLPTIPQRQTPDPGLFSMSWPRQASPNPLSSSPPPQSSMSMGPPRGPLARKPVGQPPSPRRSSTLATTVSNTINGNMFGRSERTFSMSSAMSTTAVSTNSNSSNSDGHSVAISTGTYTTGYLHRKPPKPMLVLFTRNAKDGQLSFVTVQIDEETNVNPDVCNCRHSGREGAACPVASIEKRKGDANLDARRYVSSSNSGGLDWNLARLALNNPVSTSDAYIWTKLQRVSIMFPNSHERSKFGGMPNICRCDVVKKGALDACFKAGHRGLWGEVQEHHRKRGNEYHKSRHESKKHVVDKLP